MKFFVKTIILTAILKVYFVHLLLLQAQTQTTQGSILAQFVTESNCLTWIFYSTALNAQAQEWKFSDGHIAYDDTITYTFATKGTYTVQLKVLGQDGIEDSISKTIEVDDCTGINQTLSGQKQLSYPEITAYYLPHLGWQLQINRASMQSASSFYTQKFAYQLINVQGQAVATSKQFYTLEDLDGLLIPDRYYPPGVYWLALFFSPDIENLSPNYLTVRLIK